MALLEVQLIFYVYGYTEILRDVSMEVRAGEIVSIIGPNGAGKSTLLQAISGLLPHTGHWQLGDRTLSQGEIGFLPQAYAVKASLTVEECVLLGRREGLGWRIPPGARRAAGDVLTRCGIAHLAGERMDRLSGGQQQLALIAQRLYRAPRLLILDEPTLGLSLGEIEVFNGIVQSVVPAATVLLIEHNMDVVMELAQRITVLNFGEVLATGTPAEIRANPAVQAAYLGA